MSLGALGARGGRERRLQDRHGAEKRQYRLPPSPREMDDHGFGLRIIGHERVRRFFLLGCPLVGDRLEGEPGWWLVGIGVDRRDADRVVAIEAAGADVDFLRVIAVTILDDRSAENCPGHRNLGHGAERFLDDQVIIGVAVPGQANEEVAGLGGRQPGQQLIGLLAASFLAELAGQLFGLLAPSRRK